MSVEELAKTDCESMNLLLGKSFVNQMLNELECHNLHTMNSNCSLCLTLLPLLLNEGDCMDCSLVLSCSCYKLRQID